VKLSLWLPFKKPTNPASFLASDVTGTDWYVTSGRSLSIVRWRELSFAAEALNYSQIIMTVVFGSQTKQHQIVIAKIFILVSIIRLFAVSLSMEQDTFWAVRPKQ